MLLASLLFAGSAISPADSRVFYVGRWDRSEQASAACQWPACEVRLRIAGSVSATFDENGKDEWQVVVDEKPTQVLKLEQGVHEYSIDTPVGERSTRPVVHSIRLVKRTEAFVGTTHFRGFTVDGEVLKGYIPYSHRHIEVVGDSITCGYGNEGTNEKEHFKPETENAYMSYASIAAREVKADVSIIAWSGKKMWPDNTMPDLYDRVMPTQEQPLYEFKRPAPSVVIINLATNDFGPGIPDEMKWTGAYEDFIRRIWSHYPKALVYCATGSMMSDAWPPKVNAVSTLKGYLQRMIARIDDPRLSFIAFDTQKSEDGLGSDYHPNVKTDGFMADKLATKLKIDCNWRK